MKNKMHLARLLAIVLTVAFVISPISAHAWWNSGGGVNPDADTSAVLRSGACGDNITFELKESGNLYISGTGAMYDYVDVTAPWRYYAGNKPMYVYFDSGITYIGQSAFQNCYCLKSVSFPDTLVEIGDSAFYCAAELRSITLPEGLTTIGNYAFLSCGNPGLDGYDFQSVTLPSTIKTIGIQAFANCSRLCSINFPDGLESVGAYAFNLCSYLDPVILPDSVKSVGEGAFSNCWRLKTLRLSDSLEVLPSSLFTDHDYKSSATEITLPRNLKTIETKALDANDLQTIYIPGNVETIAKSAFGIFQGTIVFGGDAPNFDPQTFDNRAVTICYPEGNETWNSVAGQDYGGIITWIATHQHNHQAAVTAPTCTEQGYTTYSCTCGDSYTDD